MGMKRATLLLCLIAAVAGPLPAQEGGADGGSPGATQQGAASGQPVTSGQRDLDSYYRSPFSIGAGFQTVTPFHDYASQFQATELFAGARYQLPNNPVWQPLLRAGLLTFDYINQEDPTDKWQHQHWYGIGGIGYATKFSKQFEVGFHVGGGMSVGVFPNLAEDPATGEREARSANYVVGEAGGKVTLNPSFNLSIDVAPTVKYLHALNPLDRFNGFSLGLGIGVNYRFGDDPDQSSNIIRSLRLSDANVETLYAAMQSYYVNNPIGEVTVTNIEDFPVTDVEIAFFQDGFMSSPTEAATIDQLEPGESRTVELTASFNSEVFNTEGITPLNGEVRVSYLSEGRPAEQSTSVTYDLHDKTALTWTDDRKVAAFITPADSAIANFASFVSQSTNSEIINGLSEPLQIAIGMYYALQQKGVVYQQDPSTPYAQMFENETAVDSCSLPRTTLSNLTGDCDDLTVLYNTMLESVGIETGFITTPVHIYPVVNTKVPSNQATQVHPNPEMTLKIDGEVWVPVEITVVTEQDFLGAWRYGIEQWNRFENDLDKRSMYFTQEAQQVFRPVGLRETDAGIQYPDAQRVREQLDTGIASIVDAILSNYAERAQETGEVRDYNVWGIVSARFERYDTAERAFNQALSLDQNFYRARVNLGNLYYLQGYYQDALRSFHRVEQHFQEIGRTTASDYAAVLLNISRSYYELERFEQAQTYFTRVRDVAPDLADEYSHLDSRGDAESDGRASRAGNRTVLFVGEGGDL
jgi:tetratricopeptide (TPR) repeat protein